MAGFTATIEHGTKTGAVCFGANHSDRGTIGTCDGCGVEVVKTDKGVIRQVIYRRGGTQRTFCCWGEFHECDPANVTAWAQTQARWVGEGKIVKGLPVKVVKGRKVPVGTTGEVIWVGEGTWGPRVGIKDAEGQTHWTAEANVAAL